LNSAPELTVGLSFAAAIVLHASSMAATQINQVLDVMMYYNQPVYIGISAATAGTIIALPAGASPGSGSSGSSGNTVSAGQLNAASAGESTRKNSEGRR
jgi:TPP-dependent 2-oxoacid decarboxylase